MPLSDEQLKNIQNAVIKLSMWDDEFVNPKAQEAIALGARLGYAVGFGDGWADADSSR